MEHYEEEKAFLDNEIYTSQKQFLGLDTTLSVGVATLEGEVISTADKNIIASKYAKHLAPLTKRFLYVGRCLDPFHETISYTIWTKRRTYTIIVDTEFFTFGVQKALYLPLLPPTLRDDLIETPKNDQIDNKLKKIWKAKREARITAIRNSKKANRSKATISKRTSSTSLRTLTTRDGSVTAISKK